MAIIDASTLPFLKDKLTNRLGTAVLLGNKIAKVDNYIKKHDVTAFIEFEVNDFKLNTRDIESFNHYAISLENQKTGVGQGNKFIIKIAYHKHFSNYEKSINQLEYALGPLRAGSLMQYQNNTMQNTRENLGRNVCKLRYGYITNDNTLISPWYKGLLLKYSVTANKQIVEYTLEGFTGDASTAENKVVNWYPNIKGVTKVTDTEGNTVPLGELARKGTAHLSDKELEDLMLQLNTVYTGGVTFNPMLALDCFLEDYNATVSENSTKYYLVDCTDKSNGKKSLSDTNTLSPTYLSLCRNQTIMQYVEYCVGLFKYKSTQYALKSTAEGNSTEKFVYHFITDPNNSKIEYICIDVIDANDSDKKVAYEFEGYSSKNSLLIDYNLNYDGTVALAISDNYNDNKDVINNIFIDKDGAIRAKPSIARELFVAGGSSDVLIAKQNTWLDKISIVNNCTMTTFGLPFEISIGTIFKCGIWITDVFHHSSGNCFVTGIKDKINNNVFTTQFDMIRLQGKNSKLSDNTVPGGGG